MVPAMHKRIPSITFADDKHFFPLQAADILAWETNKSLRQQVGNLPVRGTLTRLLSDTEPGFNLDYTGEAWNEAALDKLHQDILDGKLPALAEATT
jgi:hypothetical protein